MKSILILLFSIVSVSAFGAVVRDVYICGSKVTEEYERQIQRAVKDWSTIPDAGLELNYLGVSAPVNGTCSTPLNARLPIVIHPNANLPKGVLGVGGGGTVQISAKARKGNLLHAVASHEIGHCLGFSHVFNASSIMNTPVNIPIAVYPTISSLSEYDIQKLKERYPGHPSSLPTCDYFRTLEIRPLDLDGTDLNSGGQSLVRFQVTDNSVLYDGCQGLIRNYVVSLWDKVPLTKKNGLVVNPSTSSFDISPGETKTISIKIESTKPIKSESAAQIKIHFTLTNSGSAVPVFDVTNKEYSSPFKPVVGHYLRVHP